MQVVAAGNHTFFRDDNGAVYACGSNHHGQLGLRAPHTHKTMMNRPCRVDSGGPEVRACSGVCECECHSHLSVTLSDVCLLRHQHNRDGTGCTVIVKMATAAHHSLFLTREGKVYCCGDGRRGAGDRPSQVSDTVGGK